MPLKRWRFLPRDTDVIRRLERGASVSPVIAQLLAGRGVSRPEDVVTFLEAKLSELRDPDELPGVTGASERIASAIQEKRPIVVYGDYDADGVSGCSLLTLCLRIVGANVSYYVPSRMEEGYGLNETALKQLRHRGAEMVISVDCGISSLHEAEVARTLGLELIVTDHHEMRDQLPAAAAIVHPRLPGSSYPFGHLCGAGVAFKLAWAICRRVCGAKKVPETFRDFLMQAIGLAAIGTVADVVPLIDENRLLVRHGLRAILERPSLGLRTLLSKAELLNKESLSSEDIAFSIAPRINAAGRLGQAALAVELLTTESASRADALADYLNELNSNRDSLERSVYRAAHKMAKEEFDIDNDPAMVLAGRGWHVGVIGIVAGRLAERYGKPVILLSLDPLGAKPAVGSARSAGRIALHSALASCSEHLISYGGHAAAAGLKIEETSIDSFRAAFFEKLAEEQGAEIEQGPEIWIDGEAPFAQLTYGIVREIERLSPFGNGNPRPILCATGVRLREAPKKIGNGERHLSLKLVHHDRTMRAIAFGQGDEAEAIAAINGPFDIAYRPVINDFRGSGNVEIQLVDWRESGESKE